MAITEIKDTDKLIDSVSVLNNNFNSLNNDKANLSGATFNGSVKVSMSADPDFSLKNTSGNDVSITLDRNERASWKLLNSAGILKIQNNWVNSAKGDFFDAMTLDYGSGNLNVKGTIKQNGTAVSLSGHTHNYLSSTASTSSTWALAKGAVPTSNQYIEFIKYDNSGNGTGVNYRASLIGQRITTAGETGAYFAVHDWGQANTTSKQSTLGIYYPKGGTPYTIAPTPATSDNSTKIATTAFVKAQGYLTSHQDISGKLNKSNVTSKGSSTKGVYFDANGVAQPMTYSVNKDVPSDAKFTDTNTVTTATTSGSGNAVTSITANNGALTVTKGSTFLTTLGTVSKNESGYMQFSNGFTIQWGSFNASQDTTKTVTFPTAFSSAYVLIPMKYGTDYSYNGNHGIQSLTETNFTYCHRGKSQTIKYIAIGVKQ